MPTFNDLICSYIPEYIINGSAIQEQQGSVNGKMKVDGWISLVLSDQKCILLKFNNGVFMNEGFVVNEHKVSKVLGNQQIGNISYNEEALEDGIVDLDHGSRFEGKVLKNGNMRIPFGYGEMYDDDGILVYRGIMINWKRFGYGTSYHDNGFVEYEGFWCDNNRFGFGNQFDLSGAFIKECLWYKDIECELDYRGDGRKLMNIGMKHLKLTDNCVLIDWDVSWFLNLESIEIGNDCFGSVQVFQIDGLSRLKTLKIGKDSFTQLRSTNKWYLSKANNQSKSFHILNCESLESIQIGEYSFSDFAGEFELKNLPQLLSIQIGYRSFYFSSFVVRGRIMIFII